MYLINAKEYFTGKTLCADDGETMLITNVEPNTEFSGFILNTRKARWWLDVQGIEDLYNGWAARCDSQWIYIKEGHEEKVKAVREALIGTHIVFFPPRGEQEITSVDWELTNDGELWDLGIFKLTSRHVAALMRGEIIAYVLPNMKARVAAIREKWSSDLFREVERYYDETSEEEYRQDFQRIRDDTKERLAGL